MKKRLLFAVILVIIIAFVPGCYDRSDLEDQSAMFMVGLDLDKENKLLVYEINPAFSKDIKKGYQIVGVKARTLRQSRGKLDAHALGIISNRKVLIILVSKRLLQHEDWFNMLDVFFRDPKHTVTARFITADGPLSKIINLNLEDQPMLPLLLHGMVDTKNARSETAKTTVQELDRQMHEKGMTPSISEIKLESEKEIVLHGTALLDHKGKYVATLSAQESVLLQILQKNTVKSVSLTLPIPGQSKLGPFETDKLSFSSTGVKTKIKTAYRQNKFQFDIKIKMPIGLTELLFPYDVSKNGAQLEKIIAKQMQKQFETLIKKIQEHKIDPIGLGLYARAYTYKPYKEVEDHWGEAFANADIHISVNVSIGSMGPIK